MLKTSALEDYVFCSERLGFRCWEDTDLPRLSAINSDTRTMEFFPSIQDETASGQFMERMNRQYEKTGFCYFAVDSLVEALMIGFIGLSEKTFEAEFTPCIDIGWRLHPDFWGKGYATEGAIATLRYGFERIRLNTIVSMAPVVNQRSIRVMEKVGMKKDKEFVHPDLIFDERLKNCVLYSINNPQNP